jgi:hypothetical protein
MAQADFERAFIGKSKTGRPERRVNVSTASRLMIRAGVRPQQAARVLKRLMLPASAGL